MFLKRPPKLEAPVDAEAAKSRLISQFHFDASREALRACFLANGAALLALLSYLGSISKTGQLAVLPVPMAGATLAFGIGLAISVFAHLLMWRHQEQVDYREKWTVKNKHIRRWLYASATCLCFGVVAATLATAFPKP